MALIKCPECGKEVSDKAKFCPNCGCPSDVLLKAKDENPIEKCPYCNSESIDSDGYCNECGMKITTKLYQRTEENILETNNRSNEFTICPKCGSQNEIGKFTCNKCGYKYRLDEYQVVDNDYQGIYRYSFGAKSKVYCPRCGSENCSHYKEQKIIPGKTKTRYTANLNPLKPFTLVNKKEKVVKKEQVVTENKFICNSCGKIFY